MLCTTEPLSTASGQPTSARGAAPAAAYPAPNPVSPLTILSSQANLASALSLSSSSTSSAAAAPNGPPVGANQLRCYLCETPKQEYSLIKSFSEIVCRGCVNYEGPDRVEQLISSARKFKSTSTNDSSAAPAAAAAAAAATRAAPSIASETNQNNKRVSSANSASTPEPLLKQPNDSSGFSSNTSDRPRSKLAQFLNDNSSSNSSTRNSTSSISSNRSQTKPTGAQATGQQQAARREHQLPPAGEPNSPVQGTEPLECQQAARKPVKHQRPYSSEFEKHQPRQGPSTSQLRESLQAPMQQPSGSIMRRSLQLAPPTLNGGGPGAQQLRDLPTYQQQMNLLAREHQLELLNAASRFEHQQYQQQQQLNQSLAKRPLNIAAAQQAAYAAAAQQQHAQHQVGPGKQLGQLGGSPCAEPANFLFATSPQLYQKSAPGLLAFGAPHDESAGGFPFNVAPLNSPMYHPLKLGYCLAPPPTPVQPALGPQASQASQLQRAAAYHQQRQQQQQQHEAQQQFLASQHLLGSPQAVGNQQALKPLAPLPPANGASSAAKGGHLAAVEYHQVSYVQQLDQMNNLKRSIQPDLLNLQMQQLASGLLRQTLVPNYGPQGYISPNPLTAYTNGNSLNGANAMGPLGIEAGSGMGGGNIINNASNGLRFVKGGQASAGVDSYDFLNGAGGDSLAGLESEAQNSIGPIMMAQGKPQQQQKSTKRQQLAQNWPHNQPGGSLQFKLSPDSTNFNPYQLKRHQRLAQASVSPTMRQQQTGANRRHCDHTQHCGCRREGSHVHEELCSKSQCSKRPAPEAGSNPNSNSNPNQPASKRKAGRHAQAPGRGKEIVVDSEEITLDEYGERPAEIAFNLTKSPSKSSLENNNEANNNVNPKQFDPNHQRSHSTNLNDAQGSLGNTSSSSSASPWAPRQIKTPATNDSEPPELRRAPNEAPQQQTPSERRQRYLPRPLPAASGSRDLPKCLSCAERLEDRHFVQCPSVQSHKFCFACSRRSIVRQRSEAAGKSRMFGAEAGDETKQKKQAASSAGGKQQSALSLPELSADSIPVFCPSGQRCSLANEMSPWTFMSNEIETIFREGSRSGEHHHSHSHGHNNHHPQSPNGLTKSSSAPAAAACGAENNPNGPPPITVSAPSAGLPESNGTSSATATNGSGAGKSHDGDRQQPQPQQPMNDSGAKASRANGNNFHLNPAAALAKRKPDNSLLNNQSMNPTGETNFETRPSDANSDSK